MFLFTILIYIYIFIFSSIKFYNPIQSLDSQVIYFIVALLELTGMIDDGMNGTHVGCMSS